MAAESDLTKADLQTLNSVVQSVKSKISTRGTVDEQKLWHIVTQLLEFKGKNS